MSPPSLSLLLERALLLSAVLRCMTVSCAPPCSFLTLASCILAIPLSCPALLLRPVASPWALSGSCLFAGRPSPSAVSRILRIGLPPLLVLWASNVPKG